MSLDGLEDAGRVFRSGETGLEVIIRKLAQETDMLSAWSAPQCKEFVILRLQKFPQRTFFMGNLKPLDPAPLNPPSFLRGPNVFPELAAGIEAVNKDIVVFG